MIRYTLVCANDHDFEVWFQNSGACDDQLAASRVSCPFCQSTRVGKALMAPNVVSGRVQDERRDRVVSMISSALSSAAARKSASGSVPASAPASGSPVETAPVSGGGARGVNQADVAKAIEMVRNHVESTCEDVGERFPEEARMIYYGEAEERPIYGSATPEDARELEEEGIAFAVLPWSAQVKN